MGKTPPPLSLRDRTWLDLCLAFPVCPWCLGGGAAFPTWELGHSTWQASGCEADTTWGWNRFARRRIRLTSPPSPSPTPSLDSPATFRLSKSRSAAQIGRRCGTCRRTVDVLLVLRHLRLAGSLRYPWQMQRPYGRCPLSCEVHRGWNRQGNGDTPFGSSL